MAGPGVKMQSVLENTLLYIHSLLRQLWPKKISNAEIY